MSTENEGYHRLIAAIFLRAVRDVRGEQLYDGPQKRDMLHEEASAFLFDIHRIGFYAEMLDADGAIIQCRLLREAGLR